VAAVQPRPHQILGGPQIAPGGAFQLGDRPFIAAPGEPHLHAWLGGMLAGGERWFGFAVGLRML
jgi:hypothetical protein